MKLSLPNSCIGCPFYQYKDHSNNGFIPDKVVPNSEVYFLAQNGGTNEVNGHKIVKRHFFGFGQYIDDIKDTKPEPLIGATGLLFNDKFLPLTGLTRDQVSLGNAIRCRPGRALGLKADELPKITTTMKLESSNADIVKALKHCKEAHFHPPNSTKLVVTMGRYAMFIMTGIQNEESEYGKKQGVVQSWRGYAVDIPNFVSNITTPASCYHDLLGDKSVLFTMHIAALFQGRNKHLYHATLQDFSKIKRLLNKTWPKPLPSWSNKPPTSWPKYSAFDTEYNPEDNSLIRFSLCDAASDTFLMTPKLYVIESIDIPQNRITIEPGSTVIMQNALADVSHLANIVDFTQVKVEDLMLAHSVLWTGEPHSLNYIASVYGAFNRYKHLSKDNPELYSALDAYEPMYIWRNSIIPDFKKDQQSWLIYRRYRLPLINIINKAQQTGVKINNLMLNRVQEVLHKRCEEIREAGKLITGDNKFNIGGSKRMKEEIYGLI